MPGLRNGAVAPKPRLAYELGCLSDNVYALRGKAPAERMGFVRAAQGAVGGGGAQARCARKGGRASADKGRTTLMIYAIGRRFIELMPATNRVQRTELMLAALVACASGLMVKKDIDTAVGTSKQSNAGGFVLAKRMGLIAPLNEASILYEPSALGEAVLRLLDAEVQ